MSGQPHQRVRRNASPIQTHRPIKAVIPFSLKSSPTRKSPVSSPTAGLILTRRSPDNRSSPERKSPCSPSFKVERPKPVKASPSLRRTGSLEAICGPAAYLKGQWPSGDLLSSTSHFMVDKGTQTEVPEELEVQHRGQKSSKKKRKGHRRSASFGHGDQLALIRQRLQRSKEGSKQQNELYKQPVPGNHLALSSTAPAVLQSFSRVSKPLGIPAHVIPKTNISRMQRNSVEGLSMEIEKLVLKNAYIEVTTDDDQVHDIPDGHRAPVNDILMLRGSGTRSVDTQTPSGCIDDTGSTGSTGSRSQSISPAMPIIPGHLDTSRPSSITESSPREADRLEKVEGEGCESPDNLLKVVSSPRPNKSYAFVREPPDGCEKVKVIDENGRPPQPSIKAPLLYCPIKPSQLVLKPREDSAFCPLSKCYITPEITVKSQATGTT